MPAPNTFLFNPDSELLIIGIIYVVMTALIFPVYVLMIYTLHIRTELRENISYQLINLLNYCELFQVICQFLTGTFLIFPMFTDHFDHFVRIVGCTANTLWLSTFVIMVILAFTRIGIAYFNSKPTKWSPWQKIGLAIGSAYIFFVWLAGCITQNFQLAGPTWSYDMTVEYADVFARLELVFCFPALLISFSSYILIIWSIYKKKQQAHNALSLRTEIGILIQATVLTVYMAVAIMLWHNAESWFQMTNITLALLNGVWVLNSYVNSILLISVNSGVRREIGKLVCRKKQSKGGSRIRVMSQVSSTILAGN